MDEATSTPRPAQIGRYLVQHALGRGAMGQVLLAKDPILDRAVAIKLLRDDLKLPPEQREALLSRMRHEARASARVVHPNIVALHDMGEDPDLGLYLVFEYVEGDTLKEKVTRGPLGPETAARIAREVGDALTTAHAAGVLHRDIKPENLILARTGAKIADFGIARVPDSTLTRDGGLLGTPAYSAPESINHGKFSPKSDQFSLAATLYEAISARRAFPGDDAVAVATRIATEHPQAIAGSCGLDLHVDSVLMRALEKDPRKRWPSCEDFGRALSEALLAAPRTQMPTLPDQRHRDQMRHGAERRGLALALGGFIVGVVTTALVGYALRDLGALSPPTAESAPPPPSAVGFLAAAPSGDSRAKRRSEPDETPSPKDETPTKHKDAGADGSAATRRDAGSSDDRDADTTSSLLAP